MRTPSFSFRWVAVMGCRSPLDVFGFLFPSETLFPCVFAWTVFCKNPVRFHFSVSACLSFSFDKLRGLLAVAGFPPRFLEAFFPRLGSAPSRAQVFFLGHAIARSWAKPFWRRLPAGLTPCLLWCSFFSRQGLIFDFWRIFSVMPFFLSDRCPPALFSSSARFLRLFPPFARSFSRLASLDFPTLAPCPQKAPPICPFFFFA